MKVLWFSNTPANADEYLNMQLKGTGGWLKSLNKVLENYVDLYVAFYYKTKKIEKFIYNETTYYMIPKYANKTKVLKQLVNLPTDDEDLYLYLKIINDVNPELIHIHGTENMFGCIVSATYIPVVISIQGNATICNHKYFSGIEKHYLGIKKYWPVTKIFFNNFVNDKNKFNNKSLREQKHLLNCKYVIGRTSWDKRITRVLAPESKYFHNDEIIRENFYNNIWQLPNNDLLTIHSTTGSAFYKGLETICHAITILNKLGIDHEWRIAGINKNDLIVKIVRKKLKNFFPRKGLVFLGRLNESDLINRMLEANLFVMASHIENSPNNLCEAMLLGMPCIATYAGGTSSLLEDGKDGILLQAGDPWAMAGSIIELNNSIDLQLKYSENARHRALIRHNPKKISTELKEIYAEIIHQHNSYKV